MILYNRTLKVVYWIGLIGLLAGCTGANDQVSKPTHTSMPPTLTPRPFIITFDGNECTLSGPTEVPLGEYPFILNNLSDIKITYYHGRYLLGEKTFQDINDLQNEPGEQFAIPNWAVFVPYYYSPDDEVYIFKLETAGEHFIYLHYCHDPDYLWLCSPPIQVIEAPSK